MKFTLLLLALLALPAWSADTEKKSGTLIDFSINVQRSVANDLARATAYTEVTGTSPDEIARKVKGVIGEALAIAKAQTGVTVKSGGTHSYPVYAKGGRNIESWRMRSELLLESRDAGAMSAALGKLQTLLAVSNLQFLPAADTRRKIEEDATQEAIEAFRTKAERIAITLKKPYRIRTMNINGSDFVQPVLRRAAREATSMPWLLPDAWGIDMRGGL